MQAMDTQASEKTALLDAVVRETGHSPEWAIVWLHGLGADGHDFEPIVPELLRPDWPALRFVFPHAPVRAVTINNGVRMRAWYDIRDMDLANRADEAGVDESVAQVEALIARENARGIPNERIVLAGFSQGGALALHVGLRHPAPLAGLLVLSAYLVLAEQVEAERHASNRALPVFQAHGTLDPMVPLSAGEGARDVLRRLGYPIEWRAYAMGHEVRPEEIRDIGAALGRMLDPAARTS